MFSTERRKWLVVVLLAASACVLLLGVIAGRAFEKALIAKKDAVPIIVVPVEELTRISVRCSPFWVKGAVTVDPPTPKPTVNGNPTKAVTKGGAR